MILFLFVVIYFASYLIPQDMPILYGVACESIVILLCLSNFNKTDYRDHVQKSGWFCMTTWTFCNLVGFTWFNQLCVTNYIIFAIESIIFISMYFYSQFRSYGIESDEYDEEKIYIVFKKPNSLFDFVHSFIFRPVSSVSVVSKGWWFGYTLGYPYHCEKYKQTDKDILVEIKRLSPTFVREQLEPLKGSRWSIGNNCCHAIQRLFPLKKFTLLDSLPSHMIQQIQKERRGQNGKHSQKES